MQDLRAVQVKYATGVLQPNGTNGPLSAANARFDRALFDKSVAMPGRPGFKPQKVSFTVSPAAEPALANATHAVLAERAIDLTTIPLDRASEVPGDRHGHRVGDGGLQRGGARTGVRPTGSRLASVKLARRSRRTSR